jgi:predicted DNA-binding transcriptional regulator AlpA
MSSLQNGQTGRRALSVKEFCAAYGLSRSTAHALVRAGKLPDVKIFGKRIIPIDAAERLLRSEARA